MGEQASHSIPVVWRHHKRLWELNKESLSYQMKEAQAKLKEFELKNASEEKVVLIIGQLTTSAVGSE